MSDITNVIKLLNPWWEGGKISPELAKSYKRKFFHAAAKVQSLRQIIILTGLRRVGKTTILYQIIQVLLEKVDPLKVFYFSFDKEVKGIIDLLEDYSSLSAVDFKKEEVHIFLDEVTKLRNWASELKLVYDSHPNIKFYVSSSASISLEEEAIRNLAGRYFLIKVLPLSFIEFLELKEKSNYIEHPSLYQLEIKNEYGKYLLRSFPETALWEDELIVKDYLKTVIIDKIVRVDLPEKYDNINKELLYTLIELFYKQPGYYLDYDNLSRSLRVSKSTLYKHVFYLEFCYLIRVVKNFRPATLSTSRKLRRIYPYWWSLAYCYGQDTDKIVEAMVFSCVDATYYWRDLSKEVDIIRVENGQVMPIEVKNTKALEERDLFALKFFVEKFGVKRAFVFYLGEEKVIAFKNCVIEMIPFWDFLMQQ